MGCLFDLLLLPFEALIDFIFNGWFSLMQLIIPDKFISKGFQIALKIIVGIFSLVILTIFILGVLGALFTEATVFDLWTLIFIPLGIIIVQILLGIVIHYTINKK